MAEVFVVPAILILRQRYPSEFPGYKWTCLSPSSYPINRNRVSPWIRGLHLLQVSKITLTEGCKNKTKLSKGSVSYTHLSAAAVDHSSSEKDEQILWMDDAWTDESPCLWWQWLLESFHTNCLLDVVQITLKAISDPEKVVSYKTHSGIKERDSGKALLKVSFCFCVGTKLGFLLAKEAKMITFRFCTVGA